MDQLLFGTILFTLLAFLFPTVIAYHSLFALVCTLMPRSKSILTPLSQMRVLTVLAHAIMDTILAFMNHFPLFSIMLRVKDPRRLPGMRFELCCYSWC
jgi:phosphatidylinositol glycan class Q protein